MKDYVAYLMWNDILTVTKLNWNEEAGKWSFKCPVCSGQVKTNSLSRAECRECGQELGIRTSTSSSDSDEMDIVQR